MITSNPSLLIISGVRGDTRRYRTFHLYEQATLAGLDCELAHITDNDLQQKANHASIVVLHRAPFTPQVAKLEKQIHHNGGTLIQDIDDLLFEREMFGFIDSVDFADSLRTSLYQEEMQMYRQTVEASDFVLASTEYLANRAQRLAKPVQVHRNAFSLEMLDLAAKAHEKYQSMGKRFIIGYASGTATHNRDFALVKPAISNIMRKYNHTELWLVGPVDPGKTWGDLGGRIRTIKKVPWRNLPSIQAQFDINLAPLRVDNPFSQSKSEIKYVESALVRIPTIASPTEAYKYAIRSNINGFLAEASEDWESALEKLICEPEVRREMGEAAYQDSLRRYHPLVRAKELARSLGMVTGREIVAQVSDTQTKPEALEPLRPYWSCARLEKSPSLIRMGIYSLRQRGFAVLVKQVRVYLRRWLTPIFPYGERR